MDNSFLVFDVTIYTACLLAVFVVIRVAYEQATSDAATPDDDTRESWTRWDKLLFSSMCVWVAVFAVSINLLPLN